MSTILFFKPPCGLSACGGQLKGHVPLAYPRPPLNPFPQRPGSCRTPAQAINAGTGFLEVKLKDRRKVTVERRLEIRSRPKHLDQSCIDSGERCHGELHDQPFELALRQVIAMRHQRITLVAKDCGECMTIDSGPSFQAESARRALPKGRFLLGAKSSKGNGIADTILRGLCLRPTVQCSMQAERG